MTYNEFKCSIVSGIKEYLPNKYSDAMVSFNPVLKNNGLILDALHIHRKGSNVTPNIYLNSFYEQFEDGRSLDDILSDIARMQIENEDIPDIDTVAFTDFQRARSRIKARLVNADLNADFLADKPHTIVADLATVYVIEFSSCEGETMSATITQPILDSYGITVEELHQIALNNMTDDAYITSMSNLLSELGLTDESAVRPKETLFVLTNTSKTNGAAMVLNDRAMDDVIDRIGKDFFALPSSVHEWILVPCGAGIGVEELVRMVREVNASNVAPHERLSNHVYTYDPEQHQLKIAV